MVTHKNIDEICCITVVLALLVTVLFMNAEALGIQAAERTMGYEERLFDAENVHTIDIIIDDWEAFLATCQSEEYSVCNILIDGEAYTNVGIRGKGNTSLSTVSSMDSDRYSFKIEFDQYDSTMSYYGLDKLCLNNIIQDNTYMKDFLVYKMMAEFGVDAPLCSYVYITVNGEDWGLYLAVEGVEDAFLQRNNGSDYGELYKPDSIRMGGGRGNGRDFNMENIDFNQSEIPEGMEDFAGNKGDRNFGGNQDGGMSFGMGNDDVKLQYIDDNASSYSNIFDNAKTDISEADQNRLIESLNALSEGADIESVVNIEEVIRYFVVHNFVVNGDSYTGSMIHNYYLYEEGGKLSMIPWDYNLAFGTFQGNNSESAVNDPIDSPVSGGSEDRPMINWIFESEEYTELYHEYFVDFMEQFFDSGKLTELIDSTAELIAPYVEKDPTKFCNYEEFETGVATIREFCLLRAESVAGQLVGTIPATSDGQSADSSNLVDASNLNLSDMGTMNMGGRSFGDGNFEDVTGNGGMIELPEGTELPPEGNDQQFPQNGGAWGNQGNRGDREEGFSKAEGMEAPDMGNMPQGGKQNAGFTGEMQDNAGSSTTVVLLVGSLACLLAGLLVAFRYRR